MPGTIKGPTPKKRRKHPSLRHIKRLLHASLPELQHRYGVKSLGIFGSYIRGKQKSRSDLDILADFQRDLSLIEFIKLELELTDLLGVKVDLVDRESLKPNIGQNILREVVQL